VRTAAAVAFSCLLLLLGIEAALQVAALLAPDRAGVWRPGAEVRVLCVGDSHTFGAGVPAAESYPAHLQVLLDQRAPGRFSVINLGVPGMNTGQVLERLPLQLARFQPDMVIAWAGVNNAWNPSRRARRAGLGETIEAQALRSRLYRLVRVTLHDLSLERVASQTRADGLPQDAVNEPCEDEDCKMVWRIRHGGVEEVVTHYGGDELEDDAQAAETARDVRGMARVLEAAGVGFAMVSYPASQSANRGIETAARELGIPVADSLRAVVRIPPAERRWKWAMHPSGTIYREIARELVPIVEGLAP